TPAPTAAAPVEVASAAARAASTATFQQRLLAHLERHKRYPRSAQLRRQEGVGYARFVLDRNGRVTGLRLERSSGHDILDREVLELIERAQPLPAFPPELVEERLDLVVPIQFF